MEVTNTARITVENGAAGVRKRRIRGGSKADSEVVTLETTAAETLTGDATSSRPLRHIRSCVTKIDKRKRTREERTSDNNSRDPLLRVDTRVMLTHLHKIQRNVWTAIDERKRYQEASAGKESTRGETVTRTLSRKGIAEWFCR
jgi:hypothetical protein